MPSDLASTVLLGASDLSPAEKDDRQTERLINKRPAPSRKRRQKRGPKFDNRRRRMLDKDDPDMKALQRDKKASLADIALKVAFSDEKAGPGRFLTESMLRAIARGFPVMEALSASDDALAAYLSSHPRALASYEVDRTEDMSSKTAAYHGVVHQGHPSGPTNSRHQIDKRHLDKSSYDSILAHAKELLKTDWLQYGWEGGAEDAPFRAALDLSIQMADANVYQSKIDVETYNMLLARLTKNKADLFSDTLITEDKPSSRSAATMNMTKTDAIANMVRVANDLRKTNPRQALEIMKNVHALRVAQVPVVSEVQHVSQQGEEQQAPQTVRDDGQNAPPTVRQPPPGGGGEQTSQQQQSGGMSQGPNKKEVEHQLDLFKKAKTGEELVEILTKIFEQAKMSTAGSRVATGEILEFKSIAQMEPDQVKQLVQGAMRDVTKLEEQLTSDDIDAFIKGIDEFRTNLEEEVGKVQTASVFVPVSALLRVATISPEAKMVMMPFLIAAKKKQEKAKAKKKKKKAPAKKDAPKKGGNPFAKGGPLSKGGKKGPPAKGGKAPPFGGKKAPPFGKKASVEISPDDAKW